MTSTPTVSAVGLSTQRQLDALSTGPKHFPPGSSLTAPLSTGITVSYNLHASASVSGAGVQEERLVLIMGFLEPKESWSSTIEYLLEKWSSPEGKKLSIVAFDNRGIGGSDVPFGRYKTSQMAADTLALMNHLGWDSAHIAGVSMGGMISLELASAAPKRVRSLTLMVTTRGKYKQDPRADKPLRGSTFSKDPADVAQFTLDLLYPDVFLEQRMTDMDSSVRDVLLAMHEGVAKTMVPPKLTGLMGQLLACRTHYVSDERLADINTAGFPILLVGGMLDILIPPQESLTLRQHLPGEHVETLFFAKGGHGVTVQYGEEIVDALIKTIQRA